MEIIINKPEPEFFFKDLAYGETFTDDNFGDGTVLMRIEIRDCDYSIEFDEPYDGAAINLNNGVVYGYNPDEPVIPVSCKLTANLK